MHWIKVKDFKRQNAWRPSRVLTYAGLHGCSTVDLILTSEAYLTKSTIVQYLSVQDLNFLSDHRPILLKVTRNYSFIEDTQVCEMTSKPISYIWKNLLENDFASPLILETNKTSNIRLGNDSDTNFRSDIEQH